MTTIRDDLEWLRNNPWAYPSYIAERADAALAKLDKARHAYRCGPGCEDCSIRDEPWRDEDVRIAIIDDPGVGGVS